LSLINSDGQEKSAFASFHKKSVSLPPIHFLFLSLIVWQFTYLISDAAVKMMIAILKKFISVLSEILQCAELTTVYQMHTSLF